MPKGRPKSTGVGFRPLMQVERVAHQTLPRFKVDKVVAERLELYTRYFEEATGIAVTMDEVVEKALERLFSADHDFRKWQGLRPADQAGLGTDGAETQGEGAPIIAKAEVEGAAPKSGAQGASPTGKRSEAQSEGGHHKRAEGQGERQRP